MGIIGAGAFAIAAFLSISMFGRFAIIYAETNENLSRNFNVSKDDEIYSKLTDEIIMDDLKCNSDEGSYIELLNNPLFISSACHICLLCTVLCFTGVCIFISLVQGSWKVSKIMQLTTSYCQIIVQQFIARQLCD